ncbi:MAG TPA: hypothetical protein VGQ44_01425 [Gemmatimonadaceae bacterium]|jgi:hypothetical protein|nr:hypothetical protein [Gemmatimonadaceae bacterium]
MSSYQSFTVGRTTEPDPATLLAQLRALDATAGIQHQPGTPAFVIKKATAWTAPQITAVQTVLEAAPVTTPDLTAQSVIDMMPIETKALALAIIDQLNVIRAALPTPLAAITVAQAIAAIRAKAGTL